MLHRKRSTNELKGKGLSFSAVGREDFYKRTANKCLVPPCGAYNQSVKAVRDRSPAWAWKSATSKSRIVKEDITPQYRLLDPERSARGFVDMGKQKPRPEFIKSVSGNPHE